MLIVEIVLILFLVGFALAGAKTGFFVSLGKLIGAVLGFLLARAWYAGFGGAIAILMPAHPGIAKLIAFLFIFIVVDGLIGLLARLLSGIFGLLKFIPGASTISRVFGALFGLFEGIVIVGAAVYAIQRFRFDPSLMAWVASSHVAQYTEQVFQAVLGFLL